MAVATKNVLEFYRNTTLSGVTKIGTLLGIIKIGKLFVIIILLGRKRIFESCPHIFELLTELGPAFATLMFMFYI